MPRTVSRRGRREKGNAWERKVAEFMRAAGFSEAQRKFEFRGNDVKGTDLENTGKFGVQCKSFARQFNPLEALSEVKEGLPVAFVKRTGKGWYVALSPEAAEELFRAYAADPARRAAGIIGRVHDGEV